MLEPELEQLFLDAVDLPDAAQARFLQSLPPAQRAQVLDLIAADRGAASFFATAVSNMATGVWSEESVHPGGRLGAYRLTRALGRGGMGVVYEAVRADGQFEQRAAIKVVDAAGADLLARFQRERRILARLAHPNIARLLDGGASASGRPYFVMELVEEATAIDAFCQGRTPQQIVSLFLPVCRALEYVHRNLVVHGDLKPGNILVDGTGTPKLVDFGIARILEGPENQSAPTQTLALTIQYASPEQLLGQPLTTASDVYSLASVLYRALTGEPALDIRNRPLAEAVSMIREQEPVPAIRRRPGIALDLSRVLDKCLRKQPAERYSSMEALRTDLEAFLDGRPVVARGAGFLYRAGKAARRHWLPLAAATAAIALIAGSVVSISRSAQRAEQLRKIAESARLVADQQRNVADQQRSVADQQRRAAEAARLQADAMRQLAEARSAEAGRERQAAQDRLRSERDFTDVFTRLVDDDFLFGNKDALRLLDGWIKSQQERLVKQPTEPALQRLTGFLYFRRCVALARSSLRSGEPDCQAAAAMLDPFVHSAVPDDWVLRSATGANSLLAQIYAATSKKEEAIHYALRAVALADRFAQTDVRRYGDRLVMRSSLANVYLNANRIDDAIRVQREAFVVWNARPPEALITAAMAVTLPATMQRYSQMLMKKDPAGAEQQMALAIRLLAELASRKGSGCLEANEYANALNMTPFEKQRDPDQALRFAARAVETCPPDRKPLALDTLAWSHFRKGDTAKAISVQKQALESLPAGASAERFVLQGSLRQFETPPAR